MFTIFKRKKDKKQKPQTTIIEHTQTQDEWIPPAAMRYVDEVNDFFQKRYPNHEGSVFHEIISDTVHIDVNIIEPNAQHDYFVLYTTGMSDLPMTLDQGIDTAWQFAELVLYLPSTWNMAAVNTISSDVPEEDYWPIRLLKYLARFPHVYKTLLAEGHSIPNSYDFEHYAANTAFSCAILLSENDSLINLPDGNVINLYTVVPVYQEEIEFKLEAGYDAFLDGMDKTITHDHAFVIDIDRKNFMKL